MRSRPTILQIGKYYPPFMGGIETHLHALCGHLRHAVDLQVLVANDSNREVEEEVEGVRITRLATALSIVSSPVCLALAKKVRDSRADVIHVHLPNPLAVLAIMASGYRGRIVVTYHSDTVRQVVLGRVFEPILHRFLAKADSIVVTSPNYMETSPVLRRHLNRCIVVPYGIDVERFAKCDDRTALNSAKAEFGSRVVLAVGRLVYYKGFEYLIAAMKKVRGQLLLIGDGPLRPSLDALAQKAGVAGRIRFLGGLQNDQVIPYYHASDLFVLPSIARSEAFGIVQIEAMAAGKPVVNTNLDSGVPFVSQHGITGLTVPARDPEALGNAINCLLDDEQLRKDCGTAACKRAQQEFDVQTMVKRVLNVYSSVLRATSRSLDLSFDICGMGFAEADLVASQAVSQKSWQQA